MANSLGTFVFPSAEFGTPTTSAPGDAASPGSAATLARADHVHGREAAVAGGGYVDLGSAQTITGQKTFTQLPLGTGINGLIAQTKPVVLGPAGTISVGFDATTSAVTWTDRFIVIAQGRGAYFTTDGYFEMRLPPAGFAIPIYGYGAATSVATNGDGSIPLTGWQALYYVLPIGSDHTSLPGNYRIVDFGADFEVPANWVLLAARDSDAHSVRFASGPTLVTNDSIDMTKGLGRSQFVDLFSAQTVAGNKTFTGSSTTISTLTVTGGTGLAATYWNPGGRTLASIGESGVYTLNLYAGTAPTSTNKEVSSARVSFASSRWDGTGEAVERFDLYGVRLGGSGTVNANVLWGTHSDGNTPFTAGQGGKFTVGHAARFDTLSATAQLSVGIDSPALPGIQVKAAASQTGDMQRWVANDGSTVLARISSAGYVYEGANRVYSSANPPPAPTYTGGGYVDLQSTQTIAGVKTFTASPNFTVTALFYNATYVDPDSGVNRAIKVGAGGMAVLGGTKTDTLTATSTINGVGIYDNGNRVAQETFQIMGVY